MEMAESDEGLEDVKELLDAAIGGQGPVVRALTSIKEVDRFVELASTGCADASNNKAKEAAPWFTRVKNSGWSVRRVFGK